MTVSGAWPRVSDELARRDMEKARSQTQAVK